MVVDSTGLGDWVGFERWGRVTVDFQVSDMNNRWWCHLLRQETQQIK